MSKHDLDYHTLTVPSSEVLLLIQHHLTECGLYQAVREESVVGATGTHSNLRSLSSSGRSVVITGVIDASVLPEELMADVHEMAILEVAEFGGMDVIRAALRWTRSSNRGGSSKSDAAALWENNNGSGDSKNGSCSRWTFLENRINDIGALRKDPGAS